MSIACGRLNWPGPDPFEPHAFDELPVLVELHHARVHVAVGHEERAVRQPGDVGRPPEVRLVVPGYASFAERANELLAVVRELEDLLPEVVDDPDVLLRIVQD